MDINNKSILHHGGSGSVTSYWKSVLEVNPSNGFPTDFVSALPTPCKSESFTFIDDDLVTLAQTKGWNIEDSLLAAYLVLIARYTANHQVSVAPLNFAKNLAGDIKFMQIPLSDSSTFMELVQTIQDLTVRTKEKCIALPQLKKIYQEFRNRTLLFETAFSWHRQLPILNDELNDLHPSLHFIFYKDEDRINLTITYQVGKYRTSTIRRIADHLRNIWLFGIKQSTSNVFRIPLMSLEEQELMLIKWNATDAAYPAHQCLHQLFEEKALENPLAPAVRQGQETISRGELNRRANRLAYKLLELKKHPNEPIGIYLDKSIEIIVSLLAILKAGCAYVPIDPAYPIERMHYMLEDANIQLLITEREFVPLLPRNHMMKIILLKEEKENLEKFLDINPKTDISPEDLCYIIYTSGSTGNPKGVMLNHRGRVNNFYDFNTRFSIDEKDSLLAVSAIGFDMFCYDVFGMVAAGGTIVLPQPEFADQPIHWAKEIAAKGITIWHSVPVLLELLAKCSIQRKMKLTSLRVILLGGDWIPVELPNRIKSVAPSSQIISLGGATEASMDSIIYGIEKVEPEWTSIPYGKPMANQCAYILDNLLQPVPIGVPGELYLGGVGVAEGYYNKPELTAERFIPNPWKPDTKIYKTGDLVKYTDDGTIILMGRLDHQVKINGVRIELGEIEYWLKKHTQIEDCIALAIEYEPQKKIIISFVQSKQGEHIDPVLLRVYLSKKLPSYFVPSETCFVDQIPTTPNGKVNREHLKELWNSASATK